MTLLSPPGYLQGGTYSALLDRQYIVTTISNRDAALAHGARQGFYPDRFPAYTNPSGMNWTVGPAAGVIANTFSTDGGDYRFSNPSNVSGTFAASSPTQNRHDILGFQVKDNFYDSSGLNQVIPAVIQGANSAGTPVDPALPSSFIPVLRAVINAGATTPVLQDLRVRTGLSGGVLPVGTAAERNALGTVHSGFTVWRHDLGVHEVADGAGAWRVIGMVVAADNTALGAAVTSPFIGQLAYRLDGNQHYFRDADARWKPTRVLAGRVLNGAGVQYLITNAAAETNMPKFQMTVDVVSGRWYKLTTTLYFAAPTSFPSSFAFKVRRNTIGGTVLTEYLVRNEVNDGNIDDDHPGMVRLFQATATESITLLLTGEVVFGPGNIQITGNDLSQWFIEDAGTDPNLLKVA